ncbi:MAG: ATP-dependent Clp protease ATP-binding subunit [bacterium]|nr:ATP-dependent Clp protease ATP-binding subunit [bacterium]
MPDQKGKNFVLTQCPICMGSGLDKKDDCQRCKEKGVFGWLDGIYIYWGKKIDSLHIFEEEIERTVKALLNGFLIIFGMIGLAAASFSIYNFIESKEEIWRVFIIQDRLMSIFAITLITDLYAFYRLQRESVLDKKVKQKKFDSILTTDSPQKLFEDMEAIDKDKLIDVSDTFVLESTKAVESAWQLAKKFKHKAVYPIHLLASLLSSKDTQVILGRLGIDSQTLIEKISRTLNKVGRKEKGEIGLSSTFRATLVTAYQEAYEGRQERVRIPHLLTAVAKVDEVSSEIFYDMAIELDEIINVAEWINIHQRLSDQWKRWRNKASYKSKGAMNRSMTAIATPLLDRFSRDMTSLARQGALSPCIGRDKEIEGTLRILEGGKNVILSGNQGVGKTSIVEGIAELMASEEVPDMLQDKRMVSLSVASLVGAAGRQGELEGLLMQIINEIVKSGNIFLFIDNIQNMVGVSTQGAENLDISDILASALQKRLFYCVATTNPLDYRRYIEGSSSLTSVFQKVAVEELDTNGAIRVLEGKASGIEAKNQIFFSYESIEQTVKLSERYIQERYLPEKAITLLEEVAVYVRRKKGKDNIVTGEDVAEVISTKTNVPVTKIGEKETDKLINLEKLIHQRMVDQEEAVSAVSTALRRARAELRDAKRPIVNLLFLGPTGVGKTELAKTVADIYFGSEDNMIRLDMSEYQEKSSINRLIGAPPGYSGGGQGGFLTEAVRAKPFSLLLLDEVEKAHPDILNIFLQVMDDGRLTDTMGRTIDFTNTIIIATSNAGTSLIQDRMRQNVPLEKIKEELINEALKPYYRPEFLNRFDNIVVFKPLSFDDILRIVDLMLKKVEKRLAEKGIRLEATDEAKKELAEKGYDPMFGARPLRRAIQEGVDNALANYLLQGKIGRRDVAVLEANGVISVRQAPPI